MGSGDPHAPKQPCAFDIGHYRKLLMRIRRRLRRQHRRRTAGLRALLRAGGRLGNDG